MLQFLHLNCRIIFYIWNQAVIFRIILVRFLPSNQSFEMRDQGLLANNKVKVTIFI